MFQLTGYARAFAAQGDYRNARDVLIWIRQFVVGMKEPNVPSYLNKAESVLLADIAKYSYLLGNREDAVKALRIAREVAELFDANPNYEMVGFRFYRGDRDRTLFDGFGRTAIEGVWHAIRQDDSSVAALSALWEQVLSE